MAKKSFRLTDIGDITLHKRKGMRNIRLSLAHDGSVRLTIPAWMPYKVGIEFAQQKQEWIMSNRRPKVLLTHRTRVGKAHALIYKSSNLATKPTVRIKDNQIMVHIPEGLNTEHSVVQSAAVRGAVRALKKEAEALLPQRLAVLAAKHDFKYRSVQIKHLKSRWGSCNQDRDIILNCFLMQLPWDLIDYVIMHELMHTRVLAHGKPFWSELARYIDDLPSIRKAMRELRPVLKSELI